jgi:3-oxoadipate enol-lactonase
MPFTAHAGQRIHYADSGGDGPVVVFSHGFFMDHEMFAPQVEELRPGYRCLSVDARGFGLTESDGAPFTYWDLADDLIAILDDLGVGSAVFVGLSQGGFTTQRVALARPQRVRGIVLIDTDAEHYDDEAKAMYRGIKDSLLTAGWTDEFAAAMAGMLFGPDYDSSSWVERWKQIPPARIQAAFDNLIDREEIKSRLGEIRCPALVLHGELDTSIPLEHVKDLCSRLPGCDGVHVVPGSGHTTPLENPSFVNEALRGFIVGLPERNG